MRVVRSQTKTVVPALLVRLTVVFALVGSMISFTINSANGSPMQSDGYYDCNSGIKVEPPVDDTDLMANQQNTPDGTYLIWELSLWSGYSCTGHVVVSAEAGNIQASAFSGNLEITSIRIPANTQIPALPGEYASQRPFAGTENLITLYYCGSQDLTNTGLETKNRITCPSAPTIIQAFNVGNTYINFRPSSSDGGSPTMTYTVTAYPLGGDAFEANVGNVSNYSDGISDITQYEILGLSPETTYTFSISAYNGYFDSNDSSRSVQIKTAPDDGWYLCESGARTPDQTNHPLSYRINEEASVVENSNCEGAVVIRPGTLGIEEGFIESSISSVTIPESVQYLYRAFQDSAQLSQVNFSGDSGLVEIGQSSFEGTNLNSIAIPSAVEEIGEYAFRDATQLANFNFANNSLLDFIDYGAFKDTGLSTITIPPMVNDIDRNAFIDTPYLSSIEVDAANENFRSVDGVLFRLDEDELYELYKYPQAKIGSSYTIPENVQRISTRAFANSLLSFINIPSSVNFIGYEAFKDTDVTFPNLYRNWQTPLPEITNSPKVGDTVWASAFERELPRALFKEDIAQDPNEASDDYRTNTADFPTPEEYVYRITKQPNVSATSVDHQPYDAYESLTEAEQRQWYEDAGLGGDNYQFSWNAFMCVSYPDNAIAVTKPTGLKYSYTSREDGILSDGSLNASYNFMFKDAAIDWINAAYGSWQTTRSAVGTKHNNDPYTQAFLGDSDGVWYSFVWGFVDVSASCGAGQTLEALQIVVDQNTPITTKNFEIPETLNLSHVGNVASGVPSAGITIGVTGGGGAPEYNAALWGLTTIADSNATPAPTQDPTTPPATPPTTTQTPTTSAAISPVLTNKSMKLKASFSERSSKLSAKEKKKLLKVVASMGSRVTGGKVVGYVQLDGNTANDRKLSTARARAVAKFLADNGINVRLVTKGKGALNNKESSRRANITLRYAE
jgi:outer membrane protein OmpA-like peptidoglycan-associated protein